MYSTLTIRIPVCLDKIFVWPLLIFRLLHYGYTFRRIYIGEGLYTIVDPDIYYDLIRFNWNVCGNNDGSIYVARVIKEKRCGRLKTVYMHREIMNAPKGLLVDHKNGVKLDNRIDNLRLATHSQNMINRPKRKNTASKYAGLWRDNQRNQWCVRLTVNKKKIWLGRFNDEIEAARAYDQAARKYHGEFARLNFPNLTAKTAKIKNV
jgi:hypothetical protein